MHICLTTAVALTLALAGGAITSETLSRTRPPTGVSQQQFHDNCLAESGRYGALNGQVLCVLSRDVQVICEFRGVLGNCLWTGPIRAAALMAILGKREPGPVVG
jgi:hypothetical protein